MAGFSGDIEAEDAPLPLTPRALLFGNFSLGGVMLAYHGAGPKLGPVNLLPRAVGDAVQARLLRWLEESRIRPVVGRVAAWRDLPAELARLESRATTGRTVLDWRSR
jgi:NADPH2:quinone reductase